MLNRTPFSQNIAGGLQSTPTAPLSGIRWRSWLEAFQLPTTARGFLAFVLGLLVLAGAMSIHVMLSAEMMRLQLQLDELKEVEARIERQNANLLWQISRRADIQTLFEEAVTLGYKPIEKPIYVFDTTKASAFSTADSPASRDPMIDTPDPAATQQNPSPGWVEEWRTRFGNLLDVEGWRQMIFGDYSGQAPQ
jgi:hypothetical protein